MKVKVLYGKVTKQSRIQQNGKLRNTSKQSRVKIEWQKNNMKNNMDKKKCGIEEKRAELCGK